MTVSLAAVTALLTRTEYIGAPIKNPELTVLRVWPAETREKYPQQVGFEHEFFNEFADHFLAAPFGADPTNDEDPVALSQREHKTIPMYCSKSPGVFL